MTCSIDDCGSKSKAKGYCGKHYNRWYAYGDPLASRPIGRPKGSKTKRDPANMRCGRCNELCPNPVRGTWCQECFDEYGREYRATNRERTRKQNRERDPEGRWAYNIKRWYGIDAAEYYRILAEQGGCCAICRSALPNGKRLTKFSIDHDHATGRVRGLLCQRCNPMLGAALDDPAILRVAADYLERNMAVVG